MTMTGGGRAPDTQQLHVTCIPVAALNSLGARVNGSLALRLGEHEVDQLAAVRRLQAVGSRRRRRGHRSSTVAGD
jgi:hypothetical protein